jgi:hypothetical protein
MKGGFDITGKKVRTFFMAENIALTAFPFFLLLPPSSFLLPSSFFLLPSSS